MLLRRIFSVIVPSLAFVEFRQAAYLAASFNDCIALVLQKDSTLSSAFVRLMRGHPNRCSTLISDARPHPFFHGTKSSSGIKSNKKQTPKPQVAQVSHYKMTLLNPLPIINWWPCLWYWGWIGWAIS